MHSHELLFDPELINRYDRPGPRYTSYPTATQFHSGFTAADHSRHARNAAALTPALSLYVHLPYCSTICYYCACNKIVTKDRSHAQPYLDRLQRELAMQAELVAGTQVEQLHWGGGTPTFITPAQISALMQAIDRHFTLSQAATREFSIEIDPREAPPATIDLLRQLGFNRLSLGVQDFDPRVQQAVNRIQPEAITRRAIDAARTAGFDSLSIDLIYGLPRQSVASFATTLDTLIDIAPDRVSLFNYAHMPELFKQQRGINALELPAPAEKLAILRLAIERLTDAGYVYIGMDHFAKADNALTRAQQRGDLYRNFQGYSTHAHCNLLGLGISAISMLGSSYSQNCRSEAEYFTAIDQGRLPLFRGVELDADDLLRRAVITALICHFQLDIATIERDHRIDFSSYFNSEIKALKPMIEDELLELDARQITIKPRGKLLIRNICMVFDRYLAQQSVEQRFSRTI